MGAIPRAAQPAYPSWLATLNLIRIGSAPQLQAMERPLEAVTMEIAAGQVVAIEIEFQDDARLLEKSFRIDGPAAIRVDRTEERMLREIEIRDRAGVIRQIKLHPAPL